MFRTGGAERSRLIVEGRGGGPGPPGHLSSDPAQARKPLQGLRAHPAVPPLPQQPLFLPPRPQGVVRNKSLPRCELMSSPSSSSYQA